jgi:hypothetical protein
MGNTSKFVLAACVAISVASGGTVGSDAEPGPFTGARGAAPVRSPSSVFVVDGLRSWRAGGWRDLPSQVVVGFAVDLGVAIRNTSPFARTADLSASLVIAPLSEGDFSHVLSGSSVVTIPANGSYVLRLSPVWVPGAVSTYGLDGVVQEGGAHIGDLWASVVVIDPSTPCEVPAIDLPS